MLCGMWDVFFCSPLHRLVCDVSLIAAEKEVVFPASLHCWDVYFSISPSGFRVYFSISLFGLMGLFFNLSLRVLGLFFSISPLHCSEHRILARWTFGRGLVHNFLPNCCVGKARSHSRTLLLVVVLHSSLGWL